jgi:hypothetical protein
MLGALNVVGANAVSAAGLPLPAGPRVLQNHFLRVLDEHPRSSLGVRGQGGDLPSPPPGTGRSGEQLIRIAGSRAVPRSESRHSPSRIPMRSHYTSWYRPRAQVGRDEPPPGSGGDLCRITQMDFRESTFQKLSDKSLWPHERPCSVAPKVPKRRFWHRFGLPPRSTASPFWNYQTVSPRTRVNKGVRRAGCTLARL